MQISRIQNIARSNFQYKNNPIKYNPINFKGQDTFEHSLPNDMVVSKKYFRGKQEFDQSLLRQQGNRLFVKHKDSYIPYGACLDEYNAKGELIRHTSFNNGARFIVNTYKNGELIQEDRYEDVFNKAHISDKRTNVRKFDGLDDSGIKYNIPFAISRNYGKDWNDHPSVVMRKNAENSSLLVMFIAPSETTTGKIEVRHTLGDKTWWFDSSIYDEKGYSLNLSPLALTNETALLGLEELKETIQSEEFRADFGFSDKFNSELDKAIEFLSSKLSDED